MYNDTAAMEYSLSKLIEVVFNVIDNLVESIELSGRPYLPTQVVDLVYMIVSAQPVLRSEFRRWIRKDPVYQNWPIFQTFFTSVHQELRKIDTLVDKNGFHSANDIVSKIVNQLRAEIP